MKKTERFSVPTASLLKELPALAAKGVTEFAIHDRAVAGNAALLQDIMRCVAERCPNMFISLPVDVRLVTKPLLSAAADIYCSLEIPLVGTERHGEGETALLFDKKLYAGKAALLNNAGLVFGFTMGWGQQAGDTFKHFRDRLDFAVTLYPNHIAFPQFELDEPSPKPTGIYSSKDMDFSCGMAFACRSFYSAGRAVPWFAAVLKPLKITPSSFFADFDEWQQCNNCSYITGFEPDAAPHRELEKMQLLFLKEKYEEKHKEQLFAAVSDLVRLNGAFSRVAAEGEECELETSYNPDDLLSPYAMDIAKFCDTTCLEQSRVRVFAGRDGVDYSRG